MSGDGAPEGHRKTRETCTTSACWPLASDGYHHIDPIQTMPLLVFFQACLSSPMRILHHRDKRSLPQALLSQDSAHHGPLQHHSSLCLGHYKASSCHSTSRPLQQRGPSPPRCLRKHRSSSHLMWATLMLRLLVQLANTHLLQRTTRYLALFMNRHLFQRLPLGYPLHQVSRCTTHQRQALCTLPPPSAPYHQEHTLMMIRYLVRRLPLAHVWRQQHHRGAKLRCPPKNQRERETRCRNSSILMLMRVLTVHHRSSRD